MSDWDEDYQEMDEHGNPVDTWATSDEVEHHPGMGCDLGERHTGVCVVNGKVL